MWVANQQPLLSDIAKEDALSNSLAIADVPCRRTKTEPAEGAGVKEARNDRTSVARSREAAVSLRKGDPARGRGRTGRPPFPWHRDETSPRNPSVRPTRLFRRGLPAMIAALWRQARDARANPVPARKSQWVTTMIRLIRPLGLIGARAHRRLAENKYALRFRRGRLARWAEHRS